MSAVIQDPFDKLLELEASCKTHARPLPLQKELSATWKGIGYSINGYRFLVPLHEIKEVIPLPSLTPFPASVDWLLGIANLRGRVLPITDLKKFMLGAVQEITPMSRILVVDIEQSMVGFLVSEVLGVQRFPEQTQQPIDQIPALEMKEIFKSQIKSTFIARESTWYVLSLKALSETPEFYHVIQELGVSNATELL